MAINTINADSGYEKYTIVFVSPYSGDAELWFTNQAGGTGSYFDKVSLRKTVDVEPDEDIPPTAEDNVELVTDPDFENGFTENADEGWRNFDGGEIVSEPFLSGKHSVKIYDWKEGVNTTVSLVKGVEYRLTFYHKGPAGASVDISSDWKNHVNRTPDVMELKTLNLDEDFEKYTFTFVSPLTGTAQIWLTNQAGGLGSYFDRVSLMTAASEEDNGDIFGDSDSELVADPSFEKGIVNSPSEGWIKLSNSDEDTANVYHGEKSIRLLDWSQGIRTLVTLVKGHEYELSFYHKGLAGATVDISTTWAAHSENPDVLSKFVVEQDDVFTKYTIIFTSTKNGSASIYFENQVGGTGSYIDFVSLKKRGELTFGDDVISIAETDKTSITIKWNEVKQLTGKKEDVTYYVYSSPERITESTIDNLTPFAIVQGSDELKAKAGELPENTSLYFAVVAEDKSNNNAMILSTNSFRTRVDVEIKNGDFETNDLSGWSNYSGKQAATSPSVVHGGKYALNLKDWATGVAQTLAVNPSTEYVLSFYAYNPAGSMVIRLMEKWDVDIVEPVEIDDHYEFKKYAIKFTTGPEMFSVILHMSNAVTYEYGFFDDFYIAEITNKDLYFDSGITTLPAARYITYNFNPVVSTRGGVKYEVFRSTSPLTQKNLSGMEPIAEYEDVTEYMDERDSDVENNVTYYYALRATDVSGDTACVFSTGVQKIFYEKVDVPEENDDDSYVSDAYFGETEITDDETVKTETIIETVTKKRPVQKRKLKTTITYIVHDYTWIVIVCVVAGVLIVGTVTFIILWKKGIIKKRKKVMTK